MAGPTMKATELLRCTDAEFDASIKQLGMKGLLETISVLQKEMSREQENFNSLSTDLGSLKRNSQQYKQIQREMTASQSKLTSLMNRSMKCFQQQGSQHINKGESSPVAERKTSQLSDAPKPNSAHIDDSQKDLVNSTSQVPHARSSPNIAQEVAAKPKVLTTVNDSDDSKNVRNKSEVNSSVKSSVISVKPQLSSSQPTVRSIQNDHSNSGSVPKKSSVLTVSMSNTAKPTQNVSTSEKSESVPNGKTVNDVSVNASNLKQNVTISNDQETRHSSSISVIPQSRVSEKSKPGDSAQKITAEGSRDVTLASARKETPAVVFQGNRPYIVDQSLAQNRETMLDQIRNFQRKSDTEPKIVSASDRKSKEIYDSKNEITKKETKSEKDENNIEIDSGAEVGSEEPSPEPEKYVSKFSFPQKPKRDPARLEEKKKATNCPKTNTDLPIQEEITLGTTGEFLSSFP